MSVLEEVETLVRRFLVEATDEEELFCNEASLQHELGLFLRGAMPIGWRLSFERPASSFFAGATGLTKKEIDLVVSDAERRETVALELKCPRSGRHPETMFDACKDLQFLEELATKGFSGGVFVMHVCDPLFYEHGAQEGIYAHFRNGTPITGTIRKPTGRSDITAVIQGSYSPDWIAGTGRHRYWVQPIAPRGIIR